METRSLCRGGPAVSVLGFGCGAIGGLMIRGDAADQERAVARALELGVTYFDTAPQYGEGQSESNLGRVLARLRPAIVLGTKLRIAPEERERAGEAVVASLEASLRRLGREQVDLLQLHNPIAAAETGDALAPGRVREAVIPALERLRQQGKLRFYGISGKGEAAALKSVVEQGGIATVQVIYNLLNPSAAEPLPAGYPGQDFAGLFDVMERHGSVALAIRVLAGGALSGVESRHPLASAKVTPFGTGVDYATDLRRAQAFAPLIARGFADNLIEAALRYALTSPSVGSVLVGFSSLAQIDAAATALKRGKLPPEALGLIAEIQAGFAG